MGLKDLGQLFKKRNITFLVLVLWLLAGFSILYFANITGLPRMVLLAQLMFLPLLFLCLVLFLYAALFRGEVRRISWKNIGKALAFFLIAIGIYLFFGYYVFITMIDLFTSLMFVVSIFSYIFITALFAMYFCFDQGVKFDDKVYKAPTGVAFFVRWGLFLLGALISIFLVLFAPSIIAGQTPLQPRDDVSPSIAFMLYWMTRFTIIIILALVLTAIIIVLITRKFNAWLGIYFIFIGGYVAFLMISAVFTVQGEGTLPIFITRIVMFAFDIFILLVSIGGLVGKKAELIGEKLKVINSDAILIWLIFSKAAYEYSDYLLPGGELTTMKSVAIFYLVIPLMIVMAIVGIAKYGKMKKARKRVKVKKKHVKTSKKQVEKVRKAREKAERKAEKKAAKEKSKTE
ncbi:MAG: hypothetical protein EU540_07800 [Promethearchaeota archaeon]|nr:MAG: hypothetical protein EU540_07800 [Candidatus Lokiarchaeota archaeon]